MPSPARSSGMQRRRIRLPPPNYLITAIPARTVRSALPVVEQRVDVGMEVAAALLGKRQLFGPVVIGTVELEQIARGIAEIHQRLAAVARPGLMRLDAGLLQPPLHAAQPLGRGGEAVMRIFDMDAD